MPPDNPYTDLPWTYHEYVRRIVKFRLTGQFVLIQLYTLAERT